MEGVPAEPKLIPRSFAVGATLLVLGLYLTVGGETQLLSVSVGLWFTEIFVFLGVAWVLMRRRGLRPAHVTGLVSPHWRPSAFGFAVGITNYFALVVPIQWVALSLVPPAWREAFDSARVFEGQTPLEVALIVAGVGIAAPVCEEFFFRGVLQQGLMPPAFSVPRAITVAAMVFSAFHLDPVGFLARVELGVVFGLLAWRTGSLWPAIFAHSANNLVSTALYFLAPEGAETTAAEPDGRAVALLALAGFAALQGLIAAARRYPSLCPMAAGDPRQALAPGPVPHWGRVLAPWAVGALAIMGALLAFDRRGVQLNWLESQHRLPAEALEALAPLRSEVRAGRAPLERYEEALGGGARKLPPAD